MSHVGVCVADLERSRRFYVEALGFEDAGRLEASGEDTARLLGLPRVALRAAFLARDGVRIELLEYQDPGPVGVAAPRAMNALGLTHWSFRVDDLDEAVAAVTKAGGGVIGESRVEVAATGIRACFCTDPDGTRLELIEYATSGAAP